MHHTEALCRMQNHFGSPPGLLLWQIEYFAGHVDQTFDGTFYDREPLQAVSLTKWFAREGCATLMYGHPQRLIALVRKMAFSDGTVVDLSEIWPIHYMPSDLDITNVDLARSEQAVGANGGTIREINRCKSRAEEDHFLTRRIAS